MIQARRLQRGFADGLIREEIQDLREPWMMHSESVLQDERLLEIVSGLARLVSDAGAGGQMLQRLATTPTLAVRSMLRRTAIAAAGVVDKVLGGQRIGGSAEL